MPLTRAPATRNTSIMPSQQPKSTQGPGTYQRMNAEHAQKNARAEECQCGRNRHKKTAGWGRSPIRRFFYEI